MEAAPEVRLTETPAVEASAPTVEHAALKVEATTTRSTQSRWLHSNIRSLVLLALVTVVCFMALRGDKEAIAAVLATFATLAGSTWGSKDALKVPGKDT